MDVAGSDSFTPAQGVDTVVDAGGCDVLPVAVLEGPAKSTCQCRAVIQHRLLSLNQNCEVLANVKAKMGLYH